MQDLLAPGMLVRIPFGSRQIHGLVSSVEMHRLPSEVRGLKPLEALASSTPVLSEQNLALANWMARYYCVSLGLTIKAMLPKFVKRPKDPGLVGYENFNPDFILTDYQRQAVSHIANLLGTGATILLNGITGSGKTEVYMQIIERLLAAKAQVIILVPEFSLTAQAVERFARRFGIENIALLGSNLKDSERLWMWQEIREERRPIIIGPRSAVFAPVRNLGLIIMDEEHDPSFKQYDQQPKYHAREVARKLSEIWSCPLLLGDATPSVTTYFSAGNSVLRLPHRIMADVGLPKVRIIDMRREMAARNFSIFSEALKSEIVMKLKSGKQIILFLNRRGAATFVMCRDCGFVSVCRNCEVPLVHHLSAKNLLCHHCGKKYPLPTVCPSCASKRIKYFGIGTEAVETELNKFLGSELGDKPLPVVARMDRDSTSAPGAHREFYENWVEGKIQIMIGTQMIGKGWDVSRVGLVGIVSADTILHLPDFRSNERTFQTLTQVAGRAGRGADPGMVILQTYNPDNYAIQAVRFHDYETFYLREINERRKFRYPPFTRLVKLTFADTKMEKALRQADTAAQRLKHAGESGLEIAGPVPAFILKLRGRYRFHIILRANSSAHVDFYSLLQDLSAGVDIDVDPETLL